MAWPDDLTVGELKQELKGHADSDVVKFFSSPSQRWGVLSMYGDHGEFFIDIERVKTPRRKLARRNVKARKGRSNWV